MRGLLVFWVRITIYGIWQCPIMTNFRTRSLDSLYEFGVEHREQPEILALEAGCGTGLTTIRIVEADPRIKVMAVDNEAKTLAQAREALQDFSDRIDFRQGDILSVLKTIKNNTIDVFASAWTLHNFSSEYRQEVLSEMARVLKRKGWFINADKYALNDPKSHAKSLEDQIKLFDVYETIGRLDMKEAWTEHYHQDDVTKITEQEQINLLNSLGFEKVGVVFRAGMEAVVTAIKK